MKREVLLNHECIAIAAKNGLAGLHEYAEHIHLQKVLGQEKYNYLDGPPTIAKAFYFNPACGECGVIFGAAGTGGEEDGLEGVRFFFAPDEAKEAEAALLAELSQYDEQPASTTGLSWAQLKAAVARPPQTATPHPAVREPAPAF